MFSFHRHNADRWSRNSSVSTNSATGCYDRDSIPYGGSDGILFFSSPPLPDLLWGPPSLVSNGHRRFFPPGVERSFREADHSPPSYCEGNNAWNYTSNPPIRLHVVVISWHKDNFT